MALYGSPHAGLTYAGVIKQKIDYHPVSGEPINTHPKVDVEFRHGRMPVWAEQVCLERFEFRGLPEGVEPVTTLSSYDTAAEAAWQKWEPGYQDRVEEFLDSHHDNGSRFVKIDVPVPQIPWASYDDTHPKRIPVLARELEVVELTLAYERATKNRAGVIKDLERPAEADDKAAEKDPDVVYA